MGDVGSSTVRESIATECFTNYNLVFRAQPAGYQRTSQRLSHIWNIQEKNSMLLQIYPQSWTYTDMR